MSDSKCPDIQRLAHEKIMAASVYLDDIGEFVVRQSDVVDIVQYFIDEGYSRGYEDA